VHHTPLEALFEEAQKLSVQERLRLLELLVSSLRVDLSPPMDWQAALQATYGILADDPLERPPQPILETREPLE
jgi:hypothetical protein